MDICGAKARREVGILEKKLVLLKAKLLELDEQVIVYPQVKVEGVGFNEVIIFCKDTLGLDFMLKAKYMADTMLYFPTSIADWRTIVPFVTLSAELYAEQERKDCDNYSQRSASECSWRFGVSGLQVWGDSPYGYHAYNLALVRSNGEWLRSHVWEPNAGFEVAGELLTMDNADGWHARSWMP